MQPTELLAVSLAAATLLTTAGPALAYERDDLRRPQAYQLGLMLGEGQGLFNPNGALTREQAILTEVRHGQIIQINIL